MTAPPKERGMHGSYARFGQIYFAVSFQQVRAKSSRSKRQADRFPRVELFSRHALSRSLASRRSILPTGSKSFSCLAPIHSLNTC